MDVISWLVKINEYLGLSYTFQAFKFALGLYLVIIFLAIILMLYHTVKMFWTILLYGQDYPQITKNKFQKRWDQAQKLIQSENKNEWKVAILEAAEILNEVLITIGYKNGDTLGQRLSALHAYQLENLDEVKEANKIKNHIVQNETFQLTRDEARRTFDAFYEALHFFEAIE